MSATVSIEINTKPVTDACEKYMSVYSSADRLQVMKKAAAGIIRKVIDVTPPSHDGITGKAAQRLGEGCVKSDILKTLKAAHGKEKPNNINPATIHQKYRSSKTGRVTTNLKGQEDRRYRVDNGTLQQYIKLVQQRVGLLASGWVPAADALGVKGIPAWITRHKGTGYVKILQDKNGITITAGNACGFAGNVKDLKRRIDWAVESQSASVMREVEHREKQLLGEAGFHKAP